MPDFLINYELGWKTTFGPVRWNGAIYHQIWEKFQFSFLGENSLTVVQNGRDAQINGIETDVSYIGGRPDPERGGGLHRRQDQGRISAALPASEPDCDLLLDATILRRRATTISIEITRRMEPDCRSRRSSRSRATARYAWDMWTGQGARPGRPRPPGLGVARP